jgi:hypothetical protein
MAIRLRTEDDILASDVQTGEKNVRLASSEDVKRLEYLQSLPEIPGEVDKQLYRTTETRNIPFTSTKELTKPTRDLIKAPGYGLVSEGLRSIDAPLPARALIGLPGDLALSGLGVVGTGFMGALSAPVEAYGLLSEMFPSVKPIEGLNSLVRGLYTGDFSPTPIGNQQRKMQLSRDVGGITEYLGGRAPQLMSSPYSMKRGMAQQPASVIAREAQELGVTPPAKVTGPTTAGIASAVEEVPFVAGRLLDEPARVEKEISDVARRKIPETELDDFAVGTKIKKGADNFINTTRQKKDSLYKEADELIPGDAKVEVPRTVEFLESIADVWKGFATAAAKTGDAEMLSLLKDFRKISPNKKIFDALEESGDSEAVALLKQLGFDDAAELQPQRLDALRRLRTAIGEAAFKDSSNPLSSVGDKNLRDLYDALTDDIDDVARQYGPEAKRAYDRANRYNKARRQRIEGAIRDVVKAEDPERAYEQIVKIVTKGSGKESQNALMKLKKSLGKDEFKEVSQTILSRMGKIEFTPESGVNFSSKNWLESYEKLTPTARKTMADAVGGEGTSNELDKLARYIRLTTEEAAPANYRFRRSLTHLGFLAGGLTTGAAAFSGDIATAAIGGSVLGGVGLTTSQILTNKTFLNALNKMAIGDTGPMKMIANSKDLSAPAAKIAVQAYEEE